MAVAFVFTAEDAILLVGLVGYAAWWAYDLRTGTKVSRPSLAFHVLVYVLFGIWVWLAGLVALNMDGLLSNPGVAFAFLLLVPVPFIVAISLGLRFARRRLQLDRSPAGKWVYRGAGAVPALWLLIWVIRILLEDGLIGGYSVFTAPFTNPAIPAGISPVLFGVVVSLIVGSYFVSFGFLIGFSLAVWGGYRRRRRELERPLPTRGTRPSGRPPPVPIGTAPRWTPTVPSAGSFNISGARVAAPGFPAGQGMGARMSPGAQVPSSPASAGSPRSSSPPGAGPNQDRSKNPRKQ